MYKNAWKCAECPQRADEEGCPAWCEGIVEVNPSTMEERVTRGCMLPIVMRALTATIHAANVSSQETGVLREELKRGFRGVGNAIEKSFIQLPLLRVGRDIEPEQKRLLDDGE